MTRRLQEALLCAALLLAGCAGAPVRPEVPLQTGGSDAAPAAVAAEAKPVSSAGDDDATEAAQAEPAPEQSEEEKAEAERLRREANYRVDGRLKEAVKSLAIDGERAALEALHALAKEEPGAFVAHYNAGVLYERLGEQKRAIASYREALRIKPDYAPASDNLTRIYLREGDTRRAEADLRRRISAFPENLALRNQLVRVLLHQDQQDEAEAEAKRILKADERNVEAMLNLATLWHGQKKYELAKQVLDNAREISPDDAVVWNALAFTHLALGHKPLALEAFRRAAELREDFPEAHNNLGALLNEANDCAAAIQALETAVRHAPDYPQVRMNLGNAYRCAREFAKAQAEYEKVLELDPRASDALFNLAILHLDGEMEGVERLERLKKSVAFFDRYHAAGGGDPRLERYRDEASKSIGKEEDRLRRVAERERLAKERARAEEEKRKAEEERRRVEEEKARIAAEQRRREIESRKVASKGDLEDDPPVALASAAKRFRVEKIMDGGK